MKELKNKIELMNITKKIVLGVTTGLFSTMAFSQTVEEGISKIDSHKYSAARQIFDSMISKSPSAANYFYMGNTYLTQFEPNFAKAQEYFTKGLALDSKNNLNKIGLAAVKLGQNNKAGIAEIQDIVKSTREKDPEVLYRAAEALTMFDNTSAPDIAIDYLNKAVDKSQKNGVPAYYYYTLGDAYRIKKDPGNAMTSYDKASSVAKNKASVFTRMGTLWMAAQQWKLAKEKIDAAIAVDATYAPAYKALANYDIIYHENAKATADLLNYSKYADEDPSTQLEIAKLYFTNDDFTNSKATLDKVFDKVDDPIKYKLKAYLQYHADANYAEAKTNLDKFVSMVDKSRVKPADMGLMGLIQAGVARTEKEAAVKANLLAESAKNIAIAKTAKDETMDWNAEIAKVNSGGSAVTSASVDAGPTNPAIEALKKLVATNPNNSDAIVKLGTAYQDAKNYNGAILTWNKMAAMAPTWEYSYYALGTNYQQLGNNDMAAVNYQKYIDTLLTKPAAEQDQNKVTLSYAYYLVAYFAQKSDLAKAKDYAAKAAMLNPDYSDAVNLSKQLNK